MPIVQTGMLQMLIDAIIAASKQRRVVPKNNTFVFMGKVVRKKNVGQ